MVALPDLNGAEDLNKVQELYLAQNNLQDGSLMVIAGFPRLKVLHLAYNDFHNLPERFDAVFCIVLYKFLFPSCTCDMS